MILSSGGLIAAKATEHRDKSRLSTIETHPKETQKESMVHMRPNMIELGEESFDPRGLPLIPALSPPYNEAITGRSSLRRGATLSSKSY